MSYFFVILQHIVLYGTSLLLRDTYEEILDSIMTSMTGCIGFHRVTLCFLAGLEMQDVP